MLPPTRPLPSVIEELRNDWTTVKEAAEALNVTAPSIHKRIEKGQLEAYKIFGNTYVIRKADVSALLSPPPEVGSGDLQAARKIVRELDHNLRQIGEEPPDRTKNIVATLTGRGFLPETIAKAMTEEGWTRMTAHRVKFLHNMFMKAQRKGRDIL